MENITPEVLSRILDIGHAAGAAPVDVEGQKFLLHPNNWNVTSLEKLIEQQLPNPRRKIAAVMVEDVRSFITYHGQHKGAATTIFADSGAQTVKAIFDYHEPSGPAGWRQHSMSFSLTPTKEWETWTKNNAQAKTQEQFALFVEDNQVDIIRSAALLDVAEKLEATKSATFVSGGRLANGNRELIWQDETVATVGKGKLPVPDTFEINIEPYKGTGAVAITARLRYRIKEGHLILWYDLLRPEKITEAAFLNAVERIQDGCGQPVLMGKA